eukprot:763085-Hanusia_phi.AAC.3
MLLRCERACSTGGTHEEVNRRAEGGQRRGREREGEEGGGREKGGGRREDGRGKKGKGRKEEGGGKGVEEREETDTLPAGRTIFPGPRRNCRKDEQVDPRRRKRRKEREKSGGSWRSGGGRKKRGRGEPKKEGEG